MDLYFAGISRETNVRFVFGVDNQEIYYLNDFAVFYVLATRDSLSFEKTLKQFWRVLNYENGSPVRLLSDDSCIAKENEILRQFLPKIAAQKRSFEFYYYPIDQLYIHIVKLVIDDSGHGISTDNVFKKASKDENNAFIQIGACEQKRTYYWQ
ncbi:MAG: hypothetical protein PHC61_01705 [Chitinivibrionales bacterium]|nr:hypothetical protein [Chitinivibrionales bacterium]